MNIFQILDTMLTAHRNGKTAPTVEVLRLLKGLQRGHKVHAVRAVRGLTGLGIRESKELIDEFWDDLTPGKESP